MSVRPLRRAIADPIVHAVGARPNFVKMAPLIEALDRRGVADQVVVHTGQHYDRRMSEEILEDLGFPIPDYSLGVGSGSHGEQTGKVLIAFEEILMSTKPAVSSSPVTSTPRWPARSRRRSSGFPSSTSRPDCDQGTGRCPRR